MGRGSGGPPGGRGREAREFPPGVVAAWRGRRRGELRGSGKSRVELGSGEGDGQWRGAGGGERVKRRYYITIGEAEEYERKAETSRLREAAVHAVAATLPYNPHYDFGYHPDQPWE
ncbi:hypothetical protein ZWY2020_055667 [Hordeum vulgare]|nr:hypothetical protein ZWY2020_055667 [Hordeum vulgare]